MDQRLKIIVSSLRHEEVDSCFLQRYSCGNHKKNCRISQLQPPFSIHLVCVFNLSQAWNFHQHPPDSTTAIWQTDVMNLQKWRFPSKMRGYFPNRHLKIVFFCFFFGFSMKSTTNTPAIHHQRFWAGGFPKPPPARRWANRSPWR